MELTNIKNFHQSKIVDTKLLVQKVMPKFCEYIMVAELAVHPNTLQILVRKNEESLYFHKNPNCMHYILFEAILLESIGAEFVIYQIRLLGQKSLIIFMC